MPKYFVDKTLQLKDETIHHLKRVIRIRLGEEVILCDGKSMDYHCTVESLEPFNLKVNSRQESKTEPKCKITLYQAMPKADKFEWIIQKAVELGVYSIVPVYTAHCIAKITKAVKIARYQKIAESAAGQCMRGIIPQVQQPMPLEDAIKTTNGLMLATHEKEKENKIPGINSYPKDIGLWIGPEGGFSKKEIETMEGAGFSIVSLGPRILRTETAAIAAIAQIMMVTELS